MALNKGRAARYSFYAAGEILLVITGILIALAVAEWNNDRHEQFREHELLMELREALRIDRDVISRGLERAQRHVENIKTLKGLMASGSPPAGEEIYPLFGSAYGTICVRLNQAIYAEALAKVDRLTASIDDYAKRYEPGEKG